MTNRGKGSGGAAAGGGCLVGLAGGGGGRAGCVPTRGEADRLLVLRDVGSASSVPTEVGGSPISAFFSGKKAAAVEVCAFGSGAEHVEAISRWGAAGGASRVGLAGRATSWGGGDHPGRGPDSWFFRSA